MVWEFMTENSKSVDFKSLYLDIGYWDIGEWHNLLKSRGEGASGCY